MTPFRRIEDLNYDLSTVQDNVEEALRQFDIPILDGVLLEDVSLVSGQVNGVAHSLGRAVRGYVVTRVTAYTRIHDFIHQPDTYNLNVYLPLNTDSDVTVDIWVF